MLKLLLLLAQADTSAIPINSETVPGVVGIPTWLLISCIVALALAIVSLFKIWLSREKAKDKEFTEATERMVKDTNEKVAAATNDLKDALELKIKEHREAFQDQAKFWQQQLENREKELSNLGEKLDARHAETVVLMGEVGKALNVVDLFMEQARRQQGS